jgi:oxaloacetate decarboxylase (Na+ extruding) subunit alpha
LLEPMLPHGTANVDPKLIKSEEDIISYCLFPEVSLEYFKWRELPRDDRPPSPADLERKQPEQAPSPPPKPFLPSQDYQEIHALLKKLRDLQFTEFTIRRDDISLSFKSAAAASSAAIAPEVSVATVPLQAPSPVLAAPQSGTAAEKAPGVSINAPLNGVFYASPGMGLPPFVKQGDMVSGGQTVCLVEAMKLFNQITAPAKCRILEILVQHGQPVKKDQPLISIEKL